MRLTCPGCSKTHLPGYVSDYDKLQAAGAEVIVCTSTDNPFALAAWADQHNAKGKVCLLITYFAPRSDLNSRSERLGFMH